MPARLIFALCLLISAGSLVHAEKRGSTRTEVSDLTPDQIITRIKAAIGTARARQAVRNFILVGDFEGLSGFPGTLKLTAEAPDHWRLDWDIRYISQSRAFDGRSGWERNNTVRSLQGNELLRLKRATQTAPLQAITAAVGPMSVTSEEAPGRGRMYVMRFKDAQGWQEELSVDASTFLPVRELRQEPYEDGFHPLTIDYGDYRRIGGVQFPFRIDEQAPDLSFRINVRRYELNAPLSADVFANPNAGHAHDTMRLRLSTVPNHVYKELRNIWAPGRFWGMQYSTEESWTLQLVVDEEYGRFIKPHELSVTLYSLGDSVKRVVYDAGALAKMRRFPVTRFNPQPEIYNFRIPFSEPSVLGVDRIDFTFAGVSDEGAPATATLSVPIERYSQKHHFIFPVKGNFIVVTGHDSDELGHSYEWSQQFAYDIVPLGPQLEVKHADGTFYAFAHTEVLAPADAMVIYARNDVPDETVKGDYLKMVDGIYAIGGNIVLLDHGEGEFSLLAHMHQGSVRVKQGDRVEQGQVIGQIGMSGSPGSPHLHYQLQSNGGLFIGDGLPVKFENVRPFQWLREGELLQIKRGVYLSAD